ncbi:TetR/AcrR family transcriptional regulator [Bradyrhizobium sp. CCGB12]|uniref:TetR/AcrR family transcriptional regulator n=1 Tax=Bradyrhizobium sp. CCGB12 TaxID=2949632 RepID=UPI0020B1C19C|nr:TetR/AcrR family transcriptional regulator [Bradyrhizobium sp. CCGB12]MCP3387825.1 TetR/AcrR family transcriptional regulator [Bradyrhizobium sp. CCGB12]
MSSKPRIKQPEVNRRRLLDSAVAIAAKDGLTSLSIQSVAVAAGITKGGLFHHFASKQALLEAMFVDLLERLDAAIDGCIEPDESAIGRFTRAYVRLIFADRHRAMDATCAGLSAALVADAQLKQLWIDWLEQRLARHRQTDSGETLAIVRLAADGVWFTGSGQSEVAALEERLIAMTYGENLTTENKRSDRKGNT